MSNESKSEDPKHFLGFDLGHSETAICALPWDSNDPESLRHNNEPFWPTAYSESPRGSDIGKNAIQAIQSSLDGQLFLAFKARPDEDPAAGQHLRRYSELIWSTFASAPQLIAPHNVFLGCPSGWQASAVSAYQDLLNGVAQNATVTVARESRAAMFQALKTWDDLKLADSFYDNTLVIDVGSSTTDFTAIRDQMSQPVDSGANNFGAGLIDLLILRRLADWQTSTDAAAAIRAASGNTQAKLLFMSRLAKERYCFDLWRVDSRGVWQQPSPEQEQNSAHFEAAKIPYKGKDVRIEIELTYDRMREVLSTPLSEHAGLSWEQAFTKILKDLERRLNSEEITVKKIVLTGGASKMPLVQKLVREVFPYSSFAPAGDPSLFIAHGLARACRHDYFSSQLRKGFDQRIDADVERLLTAEYPQYKEDIANKLALELVDDEMMPVLERWRSGYIDTLVEAKTDLASRAESFFVSDRPLKIWRNCTRDLQSKVKAKFMGQNEIKALCTRFKYDYQSLKDAVNANQRMPSDRDMPKSIGSDLLPDLTSPFNILVAAIVVVFVAVMAIGGPVTWIIAAVVAISGAEYVVTNVSIPELLRGMMMSDTKKASIRVDMIAKLKAQMLANFGDDIMRLRAHLAAQIRNDIIQAVERETRLIR